MDVGDWRGRRWVGGTEREREEEYEWVGKIVDEQRKKIEYKRRSPCKLTVSEDAVKIHYNE